MEENKFQADSDYTAKTCTLSRKILLEIKDLLAGIAFPLIVMLVISSTILAYASYTKDIAVSLIALNDNCGAGCVRQG